MSVRRRVLGAAAVLTALAFASVVLPSAAIPRALGPAFPPGYWCGNGKVPAGKNITIKGRPLTFVAGRMDFILSSEHGDASGDLHADIRFHYEDKTSKELVEAEFHYVGDFDVTGTAREPKLVGSWKVRGVFTVTIKGKTTSFPYKPTTEKARSWLDVDSVSLDLVLGNWASSVWKWKATRVKSDKAGWRC